MADRFDTEIADGAIDRILEAMIFSDSPDDVIAIFSDLSQTESLYVAGRVCSQLRAASLSSSALARALVSDSNYHALDCRAATLCWSWDTGGPDAVLVQLIKLPLIASIVLISLMDHLRQCGGMIADRVFETNTTPVVGAE